MQDDLSCSSSEIIPNCARSVFVDIAEWQKKAAAVRRARMFGRGKVVIYGMVGKDRRVVYVGKTTQRLIKRMAWHRTNPSNVRVASWLAANPSAELVPIFWTDSRNWEACEQFFIAWGRQQGRLLNRHRGGRFKARVVIREHEGEVATRPANWRPAPEISARAADASARQMAALRPPQPADALSMPEKMAAALFPAKRKKKKKRPNLAWDRLYCPMPTASARRG